MAATSRTGILNNLFGPIPDNQNDRQKDILDHVADYTDTASGAWDVFRVVNHALSYLNFVPYISKNHSALVGRIGDVVDTVGIGLSIPQVVSDSNTLRRSIDSLFFVRDLPCSDPLKARKVAQAAKKSFLDSMNLTNSLSQAALFLNKEKIFTLNAVYLNIVDGVYNVSSFIGDGAELVGEYFKLKQYHSPESQPRNQEEIAKLEEKKTLAWITIAKDMSSIALASIALVGIVFGIAMEGTVLITGAMLTLSTIWLVTKLVSYFYNKIVVEAPLASSARIAPTI